MKHVAFPVFCLSAKQTFRLYRTSQNKWLQYVNSGLSLFEKDITLCYNISVCIYALQRVALSFDFPFYGHYLRQITIATGGTFLIL